MSQEQFEKSWNREAGAMQPGIMLDVIPLGDLLPSITDKTSYSF